MLFSIKMLTYQVVVVNIILFCRFSLKPICPTTLDIHCHLSLTIRYHSMCANLPLSIFVCLCLDSILSTDYPRQSWCSATYFNQAFSQCKIDMLSQRLEYAYPTYPDKIDLDYIYKVVPPSYVLLLCYCNPSNYSYFITLKPSSGSYVGPKLQI
jgi:hypothetical protein